MGATTRFIVRWGLIGSLAVGGITLLVGPKRVVACFDQLREEAASIVDVIVDDPVALRSQLDQLAREYPARIAEITSEVAKIDQQLEQFQKDESIATNVIQLTSHDLDTLRELVKTAETEETVSGTPTSFWFEGVRYDLESAYTKAHRIRTVRANYEDRLAADRRQIELMHEQRERLASILEKIKHEHEQYRSQLWQLDREIDAIERNDHIIAMVERQQQTLSSFDSFGTGNNLDQVRSKLAEIRTVQESTILALTETGGGSSYESRARIAMSDGVGNDPFLETTNDTFATDSPDAPMTPYALLDED
ncbi:MAG: hypothetical protein QGI78_02170 [Phycisphaerales bacterium]|jgi:DNA repair exonuclease SbcCD ATPase subunit|nr:hypothetical protein [Phycisphaerales bacterium]